MSGVPARVPVPSSLSAKVMPAGKVPNIPRVAIGVPVVVTVNAPAAPTVKVVVLALVILGAVPIVRVKA